MPINLQKSSKPYVFYAGDQGYALSEYLLTPLANPTTRPERPYNHGHKRTRNTVERTFSMLKGRWLCLANAEGILLYSPEKVCNIIMNDHHHAMKDLFDHENQMPIEAFKTTSLHVTDVLL